MPAQPPRAPAMTASKDGMEMRVLEVEFLIWNIFVHAVSFG
jgi:hypothetical protein